MLKITMQSETTPVKLLLEGRLAGAWVDEARRAWHALSQQGRPTIVDLRGVTYVDADGKSLLAHMSQQGAELQAAGCCTKFIVEEIMGKRRLTG
jgi:anti-anti-sigma regulatory factor